MGQDSLYQMKALMFDQLKKEVSVQIATVLTSLRQADRTPVPESKFYLSMGCSIEKWETFKGLLIANNLITVSGPNLVLTERGRGAAEELEAILQKSKNLEDSSLNNSDNTGMVTQQDAAEANVANGQTEGKEVQKKETKTMAKDKSSKKDKGEKKADKKATGPVNLKRSALVALMVQLGSPAAEKWQLTRLLGKVQKIGELEGVDPGEHQATYDAVTAAIKNGQDIQIDDDMSKATSDGDGKKSKKSKGEKGEKPARKGVEKDKYGTRVGTSCSKINACIGDTPKTTKEIQEESGAAMSLVKAHIATLLGKKLIKKVDDGYVDANAKAEPSKKKEEKKTDKKDKGKDKKADKAEKKSKKDKDEEPEDDDEEDEEEEEDEDADDEDGDESDDEDEEDDE